MKALKRLFLVFAILNSTLLFSQTIWTGEQNADWFNEENWSNHTIPTANTDVIIREGEKKDPIIPKATSDETTAKVRNMTIESGTLKLNKDAVLKIYGLLSIEDEGELDDEKGEVIFIGANGNSKLYSDDFTELPSLENLESDTVELHGYFEISEDYQVPVNKTLRVENGFTLSLTKKTLENNGTIIIEDDASFIQDNKSDITGAGTFIISRALPEDQINNPESYYTYWGSPITNGSISNTSNGTGMVTAKRVTTYKDGEDDNKDFISQDAFEMIPGKGYGAFQISSLTYDGKPGAKFIGTPNNGDIPYTLVHGGETGADEDTDEYHYNFVSNPYPSAISAYEFIKHNAQDAENIFGTIYVFSQSGAKDSRTGLNGEADYIAINLTGSSSPDFENENTLNVDSDNDFYIASGQGFMVIAKTDVTVDDFFNNDMRDLTNNSNFKTNPTDLVDSRLWFEINDGEYAKSALLGFSEHATAGEDILFDAPNYYINQHVDIWTEAKGQQYEIQCLPLVKNSTEFIPLGFKSAKEGVHDINLVKAANWNSASQLFIYDAKKKVYHNAFDGAYSFLISEEEKDQTINDRFFIAVIGEGTLEVNENQALNSEASIIPQNGMIKAYTSHSTIKQLTIYSETGDKLYEQIVNNKTSFEIQNNYIHEMIIVKVVLGNGEVKIAKIY